MRNATVLALFLLFSSFSYAGGEMKKVCHKEKDKKGKEVEVCKTIKVHKKLEGTKVPPK